MKRLRYARAIRRMSMLQRCALRRHAAYFQHHFPKSGDAQPVEALAGRPQDVTHSETPSAPIPTPRRRPVMAPIDLRTVPSAMEQRAASWRENSE